MSRLKTAKVRNSKKSLSNVIVRHHFTAFANTAQREAFLLKIIARPSTHLEYFVPPLTGSQVVASMSVTSIEKGLFEVRDHILIILTDLFEL